MTALDLMLPEHLYKENRNQQGDVTGVTYLHDRLINWCDRGKGVQELCNTVYDNELADISRWEDDRLLMLEEEWLVVENGEDDDASEAQYHLACDAVTREADEKRAIAKSQSAERHTAIEGLISQCAAHIEDNKPAPRASHAAEYLLAMAVLGALTYVML
ncbi:MAG: hypothetical protein ABFS24_07375 [Pseudomonadota bacterium]